MIQIEFLLHHTIFRWVWLNQANKSILQLRILNLNIKGCIFWLVKHMLGTASHFGTPKISWQRHRSPWWWLSSTWFFIEFRCRNDLRGTRYKSGERTPFFGGHKPIYPFIFDRFIYRGNHKSIKMTRSCRGPRPTFYQLVCFGFLLPNSGMGCVGVKNPRALLGCPRKLVNG